MNGNSRFCFALLIFAGFAMVLLISGCRRPSPVQSGNALPDNLRLPEIREYPAAPVKKTVTMGISVQNRPIKIIIIGTGPDVIFLMASIHGNEAAGTPLLYRLIKYLEKYPDLYTDKKIILMPVANPDGLYAGSRYNANGVDLNRNFATPDFPESGGKYGYAPLCEPETYAIYRVIHRFKPDRIISIHQPLSCIDYDGPAEQLARRMSLLSDLPVKKIGVYPGSLGNYAGRTLGIPIITLELPAYATHMEPSVLWENYGFALVSVIDYTPAMADKRDAK
jgi:protein MpaA